MFETRSERICKWTLLALIVLCIVGLVSSPDVDSLRFLSWNPLALYLLGAVFLGFVGLPPAVFIPLGVIVSAVLPLASWVLLCFDKKIGKTFLFITFVPSLALGIILAPYSLVAMFFAKNFGTALVSALSYVIMLAISGAAVLLQHKWKGNTL